MQLKKRDSLNPLVTLARLSLDTSPKEGEEERERRIFVHGSGQLIRKAYFMLERERGGEREQQRSHSQNF